MPNKLKPLVLCLFLAFNGSHVYAKSNHVNLLYAHACEGVQPTSDILKKVQQQIKLEPRNKQQIIKNFWYQIGNNKSPIIEPINSNESRVIYVWQGAKQNVRLIGGPSNDHEWLTRLPETDIWFKESIVNNQFIGSYSFAVDLPNIDGYLSNYCPHLNQNLKESREQRRAVFQVQQLDPNNPNTFLPSSVTPPLRNENILTLKNAPKFIDPKLFNGVQSPTLDTYFLNSKSLKNSRKVYIYKSANPLKKNYITAIFFDGEEYANLINVPKALDILVQQQKIPPIQAVFLAHPSAELRPKELTPNTAYSHFFKNEFLPWLDQKINRNNKSTVLLGSSLGGLSSVYLALENPESISHAIALSGSFWWKKQESDLPNGMSYLIRSSKNHNQKIKQHFYISANSYETSRNNNELSILSTSPIVAQDLSNQGHDVQYTTYIGGHSYAIWQVVLQDALIHFYSK